MKIVTLSNGIRPNDRAFNYGDGIFTTLCVRNGQPELLSYHLARLHHDAEVLGIQIEPATLASALKDYIDTLTEDTDKVVVKIHISAGEGGRGYARDSKAPALVRFSNHEYPTQYVEMKKSGVTLICAQIQLPIQPKLGGVKHMNRLEQVLIKQEVINKNADDALVFNTNNELVEASAGNVFFRIGTQWHTPEITTSGVRGVVRQCLIDEMNNAAIGVRIGHYTLEHIMAADALVVTNALMGVMPVTRLLLPLDQESKSFPQSLDSSTILTRLLITKIQDEYADTP